MLYPSGRMQGESPDMVLLNEHRILMLAAGLFGGKSNFLELEALR
jgi:hypothetical protein